jgi:hypothetical protein
MHARKWGQKSSESKILHSAGKVSSAMKETVGRNKIERNYVLVKAGDSIFNTS